MSLLTPPSLATLAPALRVCRTICLANRGEHPDEGCGECSQRRGRRWEHCYECIFGFQESQIYSTLESILDLPGVIEGMPGDAADEIARGPADPAARTLGRDLAPRRGLQPVQDRLARFLELPV
jgi:hypothetical protein